MLAFRPLQRFLDFSGRSGRAEFWQWTLFTTVTGWILRFLDYAAASPYAPPSHTLSYLFSFALFIPALAVTFRRLHDIGRSAWIYGAFLGLLAFDIAIIVAGLMLRQQLGSAFLFDIGILFALVSLAPAIYMIVLLATPGDPAPNAFGPPDAFAAAAPPLGSYMADLQTRMSAGMPTGDAKIAALERLARLHADGHLSDAEFAEQKRRLLDGGAGPGNMRDPITPSAPPVGPAPDAGDLGGGDA